MVALPGEEPLGVPVEDVVRDARAVISHIYDDAAQMGLAQCDVDSGVPVRNVLGDVAEQLLHDDPHPARGRLDHVSVRQ
jgi:hypothetical protein